MKPLLIALLTTSILGCATSQNTEMLKELSQQQCRSTPGDNLLAVQFKYRITINDEFITAGSIYKPKANEQLEMSWEKILLDEYVSSVTSSTQNGKESINNIEIDKYEHGTSYSVKLIDDDRFEFSVKHKSVVKIEQIGNDAGYTESPVIQEWKAKGIGKIGKKLNLVVDSTDYEQISKPDHQEKLKLEVISCSIKGNDDSTITFKSSVLTKQ